MPRIKSNAKDRIDKLAKDALTVIGKARKKKSKRDLNADLTRVATDLKAICSDNHHYNN